MMKLFNIFQNSCTVGLSEQLYCRPVRTAVLSLCQNSSNVTLSEELYCRPVRTAVMSPCQNSSNVALSEQLYCRPVRTAVLSICQISSTVALTQLALLDYFCLLFCTQLKVYLLFKSHLSLPTAIMVLFVWAVSEHLGRIYSIRNCVKYFVKFILSPFLFISLSYSISIFFPSIYKVISNVFQYFDIN
jgi:hypothetical protein